MSRCPSVCLQSLCWFGSLGPSKNKLKDLKQTRFISFQTILCSYDYVLTHVSKEKYASKEVLSELKII